MRGAIGSVHRTRVNHAAVVEQARAVPGTWVPAAAYASLASADSAARRVPLAERMPNYEPAGAFEAYAITTAEGPVLWVRSTEGGPYPAIPARMNVRVPAPGLELGEVGVLTVSVVPYCQTCGGPRGWDRLQPLELRLQDATVVVDRWANPCGHGDVYADVLEESRRTPPAVDPAAARGMGHHPPAPSRAGEFREAVELILQAASDSRGMHAKQAAALLRLNGHGRAAGLVEVKLRAERGHLSAKQAAHFLTVEGASRRASTSNARQEAHA
ncbi:hypothetical protein QEH48_gp058 [Streptomyces phage TurkishDelight]|uniref:Uncharacterized protein n=1 Tax=Streptomyces phage TurkishDelight TaxID=2793708 RepID=A0A7T0M2C4_9CAUD|nr:hypothetical protein QEH48_gp058 [Streptomyces phage TurkishDelight]QPL14087.1 hypothetical protein SEA_TURKISHDELIGHT_58 [Streptomyces phage TurkishDelight]